MPSGSPGQINRGSLLASGEYENGGLLRWRVNKNTDRLDEIDKWMRTVDDDRAGMKEWRRNMSEDIQEVKDDLRSFRRMVLVGFISLVSSLLMFSLSILAATGRI